MIPILFILCTFLPISLITQFLISWSAEQIMMNPSLNSPLSITQIKSDPPIRPLLITFFMSLTFFIVILFECGMSELQDTPIFYIIGLIGLVATIGTVYLIITSYYSLIKDNISTTTMSELGNVTTINGFGAQCMCSLNTPILCPVLLKNLSSVAPLLGGASSLLPTPKTV